VQPTARGNRTGETARNILERTDLPRLHVPINHPDVIELWAFGGAVVGCTQVVGRVWFVFARRFKTETRTGTSSRRRDNGTSMRTCAVQEMQMKGTSCGSNSHTGESLILIIKFTAHAQTDRELHYSSLATKVGPGSSEPGTRITPSRPRQKQLTAWSTSWGH
jgi:hypothetical protein